MTTQSRFPAGATAAEKLRILTHNAGLLAHVELLNAQCRAQYATANTPEAIRLGLAQIQERDRQQREVLEAAELELAAELGSRNALPPGWKGWEWQAVLLKHRDPEMSDKDVAAAVGIDPSNLSRSNRYRDAKATQMCDRGSRPRERGGRSRKD